MHFLPNRSLTVLADGDDLESHAEVVSGVRGKSPVGGKGHGLCVQKGELRVARDIAGDLCRADQDKGGVHPSWTG